MIQITRRAAVTAAVHTAVVAGLSAGLGTVPFGGNAVAQDFPHPDDMTFPELNPIQSPKPERYTLGNGLVVFLLEDHDFPLVEVRTMTRGGGVFDPATHVGLSSMAARLMRTGGIEGMSGDDLDEAIEAIGTQMSFSAGGRTFNGSLSTLSDRLDDSMGLFVGMIRNPTFDPDKLEEIRTAERTAIASRNDEPLDIALREFSKLLFGADSPYGRHTEYATIDAITVDDIRAAHARFFHPDRTLLVAWGDFKTKDMKKRIEKAFGDWPAVSTPMPEDPPLPDMQARGLHLADKDGINQSTVLIGNVGIRRDDPQYAAARVLERVLSGGFGSRIINEIRTKRGLAYATGAFINAPLTRKGTAGAYVLTQADSTVTTLGLLTNELEKIQAAPPTDEELRRAIDSLLNAFVFQFDSKGEVLMRMANFELAGYPADFLDRYQDEVRAVTAADVQAAAKRFYDPAETAVLVVGPANQFAQPLSSIGPVTDIDITIPVPEVALEIPDATPEALAEGQAVVSRVIEASGGQAALDAIQSLSFTGTGSVSVQGMDLQIGFRSVFAAGPDRVYSEQQVMGQTMSSVVTADAGWRNTPMGVQDLSEAELAEAWQDELTSGGPQFLKRAPDLELQSLGTRDVDGRTMHVVHVRDFGDIGFVLFVDAETNLIARTEYQGKNPMTQAPAKNTSILRDYRDVNGIKIAYETELLLDGEPFLTATTTEVTVNGDVDESLFQKSAGS